MLELVTRTLRLGYTPPYDYAAILGFLEKRLIPGLERVDGDAYERVVALPDGVAVLRVRHDAAQRQLRVTMRAPVGAVLPDVRARLRRVFDLDAEPDAINATLRRHALLRRQVRREPGLRVPGCWDGFELAVRAVLGQQITVAAARTLAVRLTQAYGASIPGSADARAFPTPAALADAPLLGHGLTTQRAHTLRELARAVRNGEIDFDAPSSLDRAVERLCALPGIGPWTAHYIAMRALRHADAFPASDIVLRQVAAGDRRAPMSTRALEALSQDWRPWRAYAVLHLWRMSSALP
jgi:AraC family transcriptional regulator of adaptative response / DNA-3-methyladenine glycosylase II